MSAKPQTEAVAIEETLLAAALVFAESARRRIAAGQIAPARILYARILRLARAAGYRQTALCMRADIRHILRLAAAGDRFSQVGSLQYAKTGKRKGGLRVPSATKFPD